MKIVLGSDHAGFELKEHVRLKLMEDGHEVTDLGVHSADRADYPDYGRKVAREVVSGRAERGIAVCGTGIGISIAANRVKGARAALCTTELAAEMARRHNDANVLALGGRVTTPTVADRIVETFLGTEFEGGRHRLRIDMIDNGSED